MFMANHYMQSTSFESAIHNYWQLLRGNGQSSVLVLCLAICFLLVSASRTNKDKARTLRNAFFFFAKYARMRKSEEDVDPAHARAKAMESEYNLGRAYQFFSWNI